jgi:hypothetical protein
MTEREAFSIEVNQRRWSGEWWVETDRVCVGSAYGSAQASVAGEAPRELATKLLTEIVEAHLRAL